MHSQSDIVSAVRKFISESFLYREGVTTLSDDTSFLGTGIIDSTGVLELVFFLENTYKFKVADDEMLPENLDSVGAIASYVQRKTGAAQAQPA